MKHFDIALFSCALGLAFVLEGLLWALFPEGMRRTMHELVHCSGGILRACGLASLLIGLALVAVGRFLL